MSDDAIWKTQTAFALPWASRVRSVPVSKNEPAAAVYTPGARGGSPPSWPAPGSGPGGNATMLLYAISASAAACIAIWKVTAVPSVGHATVGGGGAVYIFPLTAPMLSGVSVYMHPGPGSWKPVTAVETAVVPIPPLLIIVRIPWLVIPAVPPKAPKVVADPRLIGPGPDPVNGGPVVNDHGFGTTPLTRALPNRSFAPVVTVAVYWVFIARGLVGVNVAMKLAGA